MKWVMLEIKVPKEINKTPMAMEIVLNSLYQVGRGSWWDWYTKGRVKNWFSLEMVSIEGHIKFFIRTTVAYKNIIEAQLYAQYPDIEVYEVSDYTRYVDYRGKEGSWEMISIEYKLAKADPYPIKTYIDYGLDKEGIKEEFKIDPFTSILEYLGSVGKGEQIWIQILLKSGDDRYKKKDGSMGSWRDEGRDEIEKITKRGEKTEEGFTKLFMTTKGEQEKVAAIERSIGKIGFDCGVRALYLAKKDKYDGRNALALLGLFRAFSSDNLNGFKPHSHTFSFDFPWQKYVTFEDFVILPRFFFDKDARIIKKRKSQLDAYKHRSWFYLPHKIKPFVMTTEEIATIFHFPGGVAQTPTFGRIPSRKSEAPVNLPT